MEAVVHGPPAIAGVGVRDAPPARATDVEHEPLRRRRERRDGDECKDEGQHGEEEHRLGGGTDHQRRHGPLDDLGFSGPAAVQQDAEEGGRDARGRRLLLSLVAPAWNGMACAAVYVKRRRALQACGFIGEGQGRPVNFPLMMEV